MLEEKDIVDAITVREAGHIEIRHALVVLRDGEEIARRFHRRVLAPGGDLEGQDERVVSIANTVWTPELIAAYQESISSTP